MGSTCTLTDEALLIYLLDVNEGGIPTITSSITVKPDLAVVCGVDNKTVPAGEHSDLVKGSMRQLSQLVNLMARIKSWHRDSSSVSFTFSLRTAISVLETAVDNLVHRESEEARKLGFVIEQLQLLMENKYSRNYSPELTIFAYVTHTVSLVAYRVLLDERILCLTSTTTLKKVTGSLNS